MVRAVSERDVSTFAEDTETTEEEKATALKVPDLPAVIQGDGRHVMSLLRSFLVESAKQINLANGFSAEEIEPGTEGAIQTPRNFKLTFTRLGGEFTWDHIRDIASLAYYELRTDTDVGDAIGLLERTIENSSATLPATAVGHVYLYAFNQEGEYSTPAEILYSKPRPDAPQNITISTTADGTMITFSEIPSNCIGAYIYVDGKRYTSYENIYQLNGNTNGLEQLEVAFFDQFGEGERGVLYLVLPDVTGFLVERNGPELDFYWDAVNVYNVKYVVKVCSELSWEQGTELFRTATNDKNRRLYPNRGDYYLMVKAYDEYGNYSKNAAYQFMTNETDVSRNIILEFDQHDTLYAGSKINMYYDPLFDGVKLEREAPYGEYVFKVKLDQEYKARNWLECNPFTTQGDYGPMWRDCEEPWSESEEVWASIYDGSLWEDCAFAWDNTNLVWAGTIGNVDSAKIKQQLSYFNGLESNGIFSAQLDGELETDDGLSPFVQEKADEYWSGRWGSGLYIGPFTKLEYSLPTMQETFTFSFVLKIIDGLKDTVIAGFSDADGKYLRVGYDARLKCFYCGGSDGNVLQLPAEIYDGIDYITFCVSQGSSVRRLLCHFYNTNTISYAEVNAAPIGKFSNVYCYPKML